MIYNENENPKNNYSENQHDVCSVRLFKWTSQTKQNYTYLHHDCFLVLFDGTHRYHILIVLWIDLWKFQQEMQCLFCRNIIRICVNSQTLRDTFVESSRQERSFCYRNRWIILWSNFSFCLWIWSIFDRLKEKDQ